MKHIKKYTKFVVFYLLISFVSYLLTTIVLARLPAVIRDSIITFAVFLIFNFLLIPISATKEVLLISNKYSTRTLAITTLVSVILILISSALPTNNTSYLPYTLNSINQNELVDPVDFGEIKTNHKIIESAFHKPFGEITKNGTLQDVYCTPNIYDLNPKKLDQYFPSQLVSEFVAQTIHKDPNIYNIIICGTNSFYFSIAANKMPSRTQEVSEATSSVNFLDLNTGKYSNKTIKIDSLCQNQIMFVGKDLYIKCDQNSFNGDSVFDETTLYQINTTNLTVKKVLSCKYYLAGRETCVDQNNTKYYDKTWTMQ